MNNINNAFCERALVMPGETDRKIMTPEMSPIEKKLMYFLEKLEKETKEDRLDWQLGEERSFSQEVQDMYDPAYAHHPLFEEKRFYENLGSTKEVVKAVFPSRSFGVYTAIEGECYHLQLTNTTVLYIMNIRRSDGWDGEASDYAKEVWVCCTETDKKQFLCSTKGANHFSDRINNLYSAVECYSMHPKVCSEIQFAIDTYLDDEEELAV